MSRCLWNMQESVARNAESGRLLGNRLHLLLLNLVVMLAWWSVLSLDKLNFHDNDSLSRCVRGEGEGHTMEEGGGDGSGV